MVDVTNEHLMTLQDAASFLRVKPATVRRHIERGLESVRIGGRVYTSREAIQRFAKPVERSERSENRRVDKVLAFARKNLGMNC